MSFEQQMVKFLHIALKKGNVWRPCGDYCWLNAITIPNYYAVPHIQDFNLFLAEKKKLKIHLARAYNQIPVREEDISKMAVITPFGLFEFPLMPFSLCNTGETFQCFIHKVLRNLGFIFVYLDDILIV